MVPQTHRYVSMGSAMAISSASSFGLRRRSEGVQAELYEQSHLSAVWEGWGAVCKSSSGGAAPRQCTRVVCSALGTGGSRQVCEGTVEIIVCRKAAPCPLSQATGVAVWDLSASVPVSCAISGPPGTQGKQGSGEAVSLSSVTRGLAEG